MTRIRGFTLVEVLVVVIVISIVAGIATVSFANQQKISRDKKRKIDMLALVTELENYYTDNGNFPLTCGVGTGALSNCSAPIVTSSYSAFTSLSPIVNSATTNTQLKSLLPGIENSFGDPKPYASTNINHYTTQVPIGSYFVLSSDMVSTYLTPQAGNVRFANGAGGYLSCDYTLQRANSSGSPGSRPHRFVVGFFSEELNAWQFYISRDRPELNVVLWGNGDLSHPCSARSVDELRST